MPHPSLRSTDYYGSHLRIRCAPGHADLCSALATNVLLKTTSPALLPHPAFGIAPPAAAVPTEVAAAAAAAPPLAPSIAVDASGRSPPPVIPFWAGPSRRGKLYAVRARALESRGVLIVVQNGHLGA